MTRTAIVLTIWLLAYPLYGCGIGGSDDVEGMREYAARSGLCWDSGHYYQPPCDYEVKE